MTGNDLVHESAVIDEGATIGSATRVWAHAHIRSGATIGAECVVGEGAYIDKNVTIGNRVKIQNQALIYGPTTIADGCFIGPGACLTNDRRPRAVNPDGSPKGPDEWEAAGIRVHRGASIGAMATIVSGTTLGAWSLIAAGAVVTGDVPDHTAVAGVPARAIGRVCRCALPLGDDLTCEAGHRYEEGQGRVLTLVTE